MKNTLSIAVVISLVISAGCGPSDSTPTPVLLPSCQGGGDFAVVLTGTTLEAEDGVIVSIATLTGQEERLAGLVGQARVADGSLNYRCDTVLVEDLQYPELLIWFDSDGDGHCDPATEWVMTYLYYAWVSDIVEDIWVDVVDSEVTGAESQACDAFNALL